MKMIIEIRSKDKERIDDYYQSALIAIQNFGVAEKAIWYNMQDVKLEKVFYENGEVVIILAYTLYYKQLGWNKRRAMHLANYIAYESPGQDLWPYNDYIINVYEST